MLMEKYNNILELINSNNPTWVMHSGVPFVICSYIKEDNKTVPIVVKKLKEEMLDFRVIEINIEQAILEIIEKNEGIDKIIELEKSEGSIDLSKELGEVILEDLREYIISKSNEVGEKGRILITRLGATANYFNFIRLISYLEGKVNIPTIFFYPGKCDKYSSVLLDKHKETTIRAFYI